MNTSSRESTTGSSKKIATVILVIAVLVVSAFLVNSSESAQASNEASVGSFFSRVFGNVGNLFKGKNRIEKEQMSNLVLNQEDEFGNLVAWDGAPGFVLGQGRPLASNFADIAISENESIIGGGITQQVEDSYVFILPEKSLAQKQIEILQRENVALNPVTTIAQKDSLQGALSESTEELKQHEAKIKTQQKILLDTIEERFGSLEKEELLSRPFTDYRTANSSVEVRTHTVGMNSIFVTGITEADVDALSRGLPPRTRVEPVKEVQVSVEDSGEYIGSTDVWSYFDGSGISVLGEGVTVGIIDTGIDYTHPDFGSCSFLEEGGCKVIGGYDFVNNDPDPIDDHGHGTHVAGTVGADAEYVIGGNATSFKGIAPHVRLVGYKVLSASGSGSSMGVMAAMEACLDPNGDGLIDDKLTICSMSLGSPQGTAMDPDAMLADTIMDAGVILTIAAGNDGPSFGTIGSPGSSKKAITVGAGCKPADINSNQRCAGSPLATFSSRGPVESLNDQGQIELITKPDIIAPGVNICASQWSSWMYQNECLGTGQHIAINGTSMATPVVAGVVALLAQLYPDFSPAEIKDVIKLNGINLSETLGLNEQGSGLINPLGVIDNIGLPNAEFTLSGTPFFFANYETDNDATYSKEITFTNIKDYPLDLSLEDTTENPGINLQFPETLTIPPNTSINTEITMNVDMTAVGTGLNVFELIEITSPTNETPARLSLGHFAPRKIQLDVTELPFPVFPEFSETYEQTLSVNATNRMSEQSLTLNLTLADFNKPNVSASIPFDTITIEPGETVSIPVTVTADNLLTLGWAKSSLQIVSGDELYGVPIRLYRGYVMSFDFGDTVPSSLTLFHGGSTVYHKNFTLNDPAGVFTLHTTNSGPYEALVNYLGDSGPDLVYIEDIDLYGQESTPIFDVQRDLAVYTIENNIDLFNCMASFSNPRQGVLAGYLTNSPVVFKHNILPVDVDFGMSCGGFDVDSRALTASQVYIDSNINQDYTINQNNSDQATRVIYTSNPVDQNAAVSLGYALCNFRDFSESGDVDSTYSICNFRRTDGGGDKITLARGEAAVLKSYTFTTNTPDLSDVPSYPAFRLHTFDPNSGKTWSFGPEMFVTSSKVFAWDAPSSGVLTEAGSLANFYQNYKIDLVNDGYISVGTNPLVNTLSLRSFEQTFNFFSHWSNSRTGLYSFGDQSNLSLMTSNNSSAVDASFFVDNTFVAETTIFPAIAGLNILRLPNEDGVINNNGQAKLGDYEVTVSYDGEGWTGLENFDFDTRFNFTIDDTDQDRRPPFVKSINLVSDEIIQDVYDPNTSMQIVVNADPGKKITSFGFNDDDSSYLTYGEDSISNIEISLEGGLAVPLTESLSDGKYYADISSVNDSNNDGFITFELSIEDQGGNFTVSSFVMPIGERLTQYNLSNPAVLECIEAAPTVWFSSDELGLNPDESKPLSVYFQNNNSVGCGGDAFSLKISSSDSDVTHKSSLPVGNSTVGTYQIRPMGGIVVGYIAPGAVGYADFFVKAKNIATQGDEHEIVATLADNLIDDFSWGADVYQSIPVYIGEVPEEVPEQCRADFNGDGQISTADQLMFNTAYGTINATYDLNESGGVINADDLITFLSFYGQGGCPAAAPPDENEENNYTDVKNDPDIVISYQIETEGVSPTIYNYEVTITNNGGTNKTNLVAYNIIPDPQLPYAEFIAATVPDLEVDLQTGALYLPSINGGESITVFITVTMPN